MSFLEKQSEEEVWKSLLTESISYEEQSHNCKIGEIFTDILIISNCNICGRSNILCGVRAFVLFREEQLEKSVPLPGEQPLKRLLLFCCLNCGESDKMRTSKLRRARAAIRRAFRVTAKNQDLALWLSGSSAKGE